MLRVLQPSSKVCTKACTSCPNAQRRDACNLAEPCPGYGTSKVCPPLVVLAVVDYAQRVLAAATLPVFGSMRSATA